MKLKPEIKALWVDALRSGKYQQGIGALQTSEGQFCCLGVLCDLHMNHTDTKEKWEHDPNNPSCFGNMTYLRNRSNCPFKVYDWAMDIDPDDLRVLRIFYDTKFCGLDELNDSYKLSFHNIADLIEAQL